MKTLLIPTRAVSLGGSLRWVETLCSSLPAFGWRVVLGVAKEIGGEACEFAEDRKGVECLIVRAPTDTREGRRRALRRLIRHVRPDVVVPHLLGDAFPAIVAEKERDHRLRFVVRAQELYPPMNADVIHWSGASDAIVGVSKAIVRLISRFAEIPKDRISQIPGGVLAPCRVRTLDARLPVGIRLGYVGRLAPEKRILDLAGVVRSLDKRGVRFTLEIAGDGPEAGALRRELVGEERAGVVRFLGVVNRAVLYEKHYPNWDASLLTSPSEGIPVALLEGMVNGVVPVVSDFRGRADEGLLRHRETALVYPVGDVEAAAECIAELQLDAALMKKLSEAAVEATLGIYTEDVAAERWFRLLEGVVQREPRRIEMPRPTPEPAGRLDRWLGSNTGEEVRRLLRFRSSGGRWPIATNECPGLISRIEEELRLSSL